LQGLRKVVIWLLGGRDFASFTRRVRLHVFLLQSLGHSYVCSSAMFEHLREFGSAPENPNGYSIALFISAEKRVSVAELFD
jgi:hypothetical protein